MNFCGKFQVLYYVKKFLPKIRTALCFVACAALMIAVPCLAKPQGAESRAKSHVSITVWQIDGFEGGKGSRADFLRSAGEEYSRSSGNYVTVQSITSQAARQNIADGNVPDAVSYAAGFYGLEGVICGSPSYTLWCRGCYCILTLDGDFSDITAENTVINQGKDNFPCAAAMLYGIGGAAEEGATTAYLQLLNGKYKYLLGTQRDVFRLRTRGAAYKILPLTVYNDLYQLISLTSSSAERRTAAKEFINFLTLKTAQVTKLGLFFDGRAKYDDDLACMQNLKFEYGISTPVSYATHAAISAAISGGDINMLKNLLK